MAFPHPLRIQPAHLMVEDNKVVDAQHGDWYFQYEGVEETTYVYLEGSGLLDLIEQQQDLVVCEVGFGTGLTFALVQAALRERGYRGRLRYVGVERAPLTADQAKIANAQRPVELAWLPPSERPRAGFVQASDDLLLLHGEASEALSRLEAKIDLWFLDGFSPSKNPDAWTPALFEQVARLSRPGAKLSTFTAVSDVRRGLEAVGFHVNRRSGWGKKREHLTGEFAGDWTPRARPIGPLNIAGAGIAGLNLALEAQKAGWSPVVHGTGLKPQGSAVPRALVNFKPSGDLGPLGHLRRAAFFALSNYEALADFGVETVVSDPKVKARWADEQDVEHHWTGDDRVMVSKAFSLETEAFQTAVLSQVEHHPEALDAVQETTVIAAGLGSKAFADLRLNPNRGQQDLVNLDPPLNHPLNFGRLLLPLGQGEQAWLGASFDRQPGDDWADPSLKDREENLSRARTHLPDMTFADQGQSWVGLRATTPDHLPLAAWLSPNLAVLSGLGSKGFLYAPISAQCLIAESLELPLPLENWVWRALHPNRFQKKEA